MVGRDNNVITTLRTRQHIDQEIAKLLQAKSESEFNAQAERITASGDQVIPVILNNLKRATPQMLNVLGMLAALCPDRDQITDRLYDIAADETQPDRHRISALLILERHLGEEPDPSLVSSLDDPQALVKESVQEMLAEAEADPLILLDYMRGLSEQSEDVLENVVETLLLIGQERAVRILCLLAQDEPESLAQAALHALGKIDRSEAVRGLQTLQAMLPPSRLPTCERSLRKLAFKGVPIEPLPPVNADWRTLVSAPDGEGNRVVWFLRQPDKAGHHLFWGVSTDSNRGIVQAYGNALVPSGVLPPLQPQGYIHSVSPEDGLVMYMLETDLEYGRRIVREGVQRTLALGEQPPVEYLLLGTFIWAYAPDQDPIAIPDRPAADRTNNLVSESANLLAHPAFQTWFVYGDRVIQKALALMRRSTARPEANMARWTAQLAEDHFDEQTITRLQIQLEASAEWLFRARQTHLAQVAFAAAAALTEIPPNAHPFTLRMAERGIEIVLEQLHRQLGLSPD
ncbi:MAG: hypothetical protein JW934_21405 [Anaerolineae bacterium]|nr:hypothetical protein [Anaerolineae bacterium]